MTSTQILAATFTIAFEGLMLFQGPSASEKTHVWIVDAPEHNAFVEETDKDGNIVQWIPLTKGDQITFGKKDQIPFGERGVGYTGHWFDRYVVTLKDHVVFGNVDQAVVMNDVSHTGTLARAYLPDGNLTILFTFHDRVRLDTWFTFSSTHCFPRYVLLTTQTSGVVTTRITHEDGSYEDLEINSGIVVVSNGGLPHEGKSKVSHFHEYRRLLSTFARLETATFPVDPPCYADLNDPQPIPPGLDDEVVNALRKRIPRIPSGDCGPVDNP